MNDDAARRAFNQFIACPLCGNVDADLEATVDPSDDPSCLVENPSIRASCSECGVETEWIDL